MSPVLRNTRISSSLGCACRKLTRPGLESGVDAESCSKSREPMNQRCVDRTRAGRDRAAASCMYMLTCCVLGSSTLHACIGPAGMAFYMHAPWLVAIAKWMAEECKDGSSPPVPARSYGAGRKTQRGVAIQYKYNGTGMHVRVVVVSVSAGGSQLGEDRRQNKSQERQRPHVRHAAASRYVYVPEPVSPCKCMIYSMMMMHA